MWVQGSKFLHPYVLFLADVSWVAMFQNRESVILVESVGFIGIERSLAAMVEFGFIPCDRSKICPTFTMPTAARIEG